MIRKALAAVAILIALVGLGLVLFARGVIGGETVRQTLETQLSAKLGTPVKIASLGASFFPRVALDLHDVSIGQPAKLTIAEVSIATGLRGLLSRRVEDASVIISNSRLPVETAVGMAGAAATGGPSGGSGGLTIVSVRTLALRHVELVVGSRSLMVDLESSIDGDRLDVSRLVAQSEGTRLEAHGTLTSIAQTRGKFTASAGRLNLDEVLALASGVSAPAGAAGAPAAGASALDVTVELTAPEGELGGYAFQKLASMVRITPRRLEVEPLRFGMFGGEYDGRLGIGLSGDAPEAALGGRVEGLDVSRILKETQGSTSMSGRMGGTFSLTTRGASSSEMLRAARGTGRATIVDGGIPGLDMVRSVVLAFGKPSGAPAPGTGSRFTRIESAFTLADQTLRSSDIAFASRDFDMSGSGSVRLPAGALDVHADVVLSRELTAQAGTDLRRYAQEDGRIVVPATITGTLASPRVSLDVAAAANRALQNEVKRKVKGLLDRIIR
jgi:uncharacterized protein involved in outer membrane biogenesis